MKRSLEFYCNVLGFPIIRVVEMDKKAIRELYGLDENVQVKVVILRTGWGSFVELFEFSSLEEGIEVKWNRPGITHIALDVGNLHKTYRELKDRGFEFVIEPMKTGGPDWVFMKDPDGNLVELIDMGILHYANRFFGKLFGKLNMKFRYKDLGHVV